MQGDREKCLEAGMDDYVAKPVRLEDIRTMVERWGPTAATPDALAAGAGEAQHTAESPAEPVTPAAATAPGDASAEEDPVDIDRLLEFTEGNSDSFRELVTLYLNQTREQVAQLLAAIKAADAFEIRRVAHSCAGASATCGMSKLVLSLRELERQGTEGKLTNACELGEEVSREFDRIRNFLETYMARHCDLAAKA
jgi:HPt (histidine-containing phosphotransfer) domain-containing protein